MTQWENDSGPWYVYHIQNPKDSSLSHGYVGVTVNLDGRFADHFKTDSHVGRAIRAYNLSRDDMKIIATYKTSDEAYHHETDLRPIGE